MTGLKIAGGCHAYMEIVAVEGNSVCEQTEVGLGFSLDLLY